MDLQTDSSIDNLIRLIVNDEIDQALRILEAEDARERFLEPWGSRQFTLLQIAARQGSLDVLQRLYFLGADLEVADAFGSCVVHHAALNGRVDVVRWFLERLVADGKFIGTWLVTQVYSPHSSGTTALHEAVRGLHLDVVRLLVDAGAHVNFQDSTGYTPLLIACVMVHPHDHNHVSRFEEIVDVLVSASASVNIVHPETGMTPLHYAVRVNSQKATNRLIEGGACRTAQSASDRSTPLHVAAEYGHHRSLYILLEHLDPWLIDMQDKVRRTPLYIAATAGHMKCVHALIKNGASLASQAKSGLTVIDVLFRYEKRPIAFFTELLDAGVYLTEGDANTVTLDFRVLAPQGERQMAVVSALIRAVPSMEKMKILQHPVVEAFLGLKWTRLSYSFVILVIFQAMFVACLYTYSVVILQERVVSSTPREMLFIFAVILLCHDLLRLLMIPKYYVRQFETWISMICATICIVVTVHAEFNTWMKSGFSKSCEPPPSWVLQSICVAILLACIQVMLLFGQFPTWGYYALMFSTILKNVSKVFLAVVWIIVGFSLSFSVLFHAKDDFGNPWKAFVKTVVMMMGEYEYSDLYPLTDEKNSAVNNTNSDKSRNTLLPITSRIVFLVFVMFASIVLMNLMIGLAVTDIKELLNEGLVRRLLKQAEFVSHLEQVTSHWIFRSCLVPRCLTKLLESKNTIPTEIDLGSSARHGKRPRGISEKLVEKLFDLSLKNRNLREKFETASPYYKNGDSFTETIFYLQEGVKKLQREKQRLQEIQFPECKIERRRKSTTS